MQTLTISEQQQFAEGTLRFYRIPDEWDEDDFRYWWCPETDRRGNILRPARISKADKESCFVLEHIVHNQIMNAGRSQILSYIGSSSGSSTAWAQYFAIGTGALTATTPSDTTLANEVFRKAPATYSTSGTEVDINIQLGSTDAEYTYTNAGIFGNGATATLGTGTLETHALFSYTKGAYAIAIDYLINLL